MMKHYYLSSLLVIVITLSTCSPYSNSIYFQGIDRNPALSHKIDNYAPLTIQTGDVLDINFRSLSPEGSAMFNSQGSAPSATGGGSGASVTPMGYTVDQKGDIELPLAHNVKVVGLTIAEAQNTVQKAVLPFLKEAIVTIHISNFKITVMGDVSRPDSYSITSEHISIPQALTLAGNITMTGRRDNVLLIREINGERKFVNIDLTSSRLFESPYYYLKNNDMLYVEEGRGKFATISPVKQNLPIVLSIVSLLLIAFEVVRNVRK